MLYTPHFLTGALAAKFIPNPFIAYPVALISHVLLDLTPHNDFDIEPGMTLKDVIKHDRRKRNILFGALAIDGSLLLMSALWIYNTLSNPIHLLIGGFFAILPDLLEQSLLLLGYRLPAIQDKFQYRIGMKYGFLSYPIVSLAALYFLVR